MSLVVGSAVRRSAPWLEASLVVGVATLLGVALGAGLPAVVWLVAAGVPVLVLAVARPEYGALLVVLALVLVPRDTLFRYGIAFGPGSLKVTDVLLGASLGGYLVQRWWTAPSRSRVPLAAALVTVVVVGMLGAVNGTLSGVDATWALLELRQLLVLLVAFPLAGAVGRSRRFGRVVLVSVLVAASLHSGVIVWRFLAGAGSTALFSGGATRVDDVVVMFPMLGIVWVACSLAYVRHRALQAVLVAMASLMVVAVLLTFLRGAWLALVVGLAVAVALDPGLRRPRVWAAVLVTAGLVAAALATLTAVGPGSSSGLVSAVVGRALSIGDPSDVSGGHRAAENRAALAMVAERPIAGHGLGAEVRFVSPMYSPVNEASGTGFTAVYLHNSWTWLAVKLGLVGVAAYAVLVAGLARSARRRIVSESAVDRSLFRAVLAGLVMLWAFSLTGPHLTVEPSTAALALMVAALALPATVAASPGSHAHPGR